MTATMAALQYANDALAKDCPVLLDLLAERGKRFFFPSKGILAQGAEAKQKAKTANATVGIATENGAPMNLACVSKYFSGLTPGEVFDYAPSYGKPDVRAAWAKKQRAETPSLGEHPLSSPCAACTAGSGSTPGRSMASSWSSGGSTTTTGSC